MTGPGRPHRCPYCSGTRSVAKGFRYNKTGKVKLRRCKECGRRWTTAPVAGDAPSAAPVAVETAPVVPEPMEDASADIPGRADEREDTAGVVAGCGQEPERTTELSLSGDGGPRQNDSGAEEREESEDTFFAQ